MLVRQLYCPTSELEWDVGMTLYQNISTEDVAFIFMIKKIYHPLQQSYIHINATPHNTLCCVDKCDECYFFFNKRLIFFIARIRDIHFLIDRIGL